MLTELRRVKNLIKLQTGMLLRLYKSQLIGQMASLAYTGKAGVT